jgi:archaemetzincin
MEINIAPLEFSNKILLERIRKALSGIYRSNVEVIPLKIRIDKEYNDDRKQYFSTGIISQAVRKSEPFLGKILMLMESDIFVPVFTFLFGEAQLAGKHALVSVCRLHEEFYSGKTDDGLLFERTLKEAMHELGHTYGLVHCKDWNCVMHPSRNVEEIDIKPAAYCETCSEKIPFYNPLFPVSDDAIEPTSQAI